MNEPFWQRSIDDLGYEDIATFIAEGVPEGDHLEYKLPTYNEQNHKVEFTPQFLETIVAFANTGEGMMIVGIREDPKTKRPAKIEGISLAAEKRPRDLAVSLRDACAQAIEPTVPLEARTFIIPEDEDAAGHTLLVIRIRRGLQPPYNLLEHGIFLRNGDRDDRARVLQIQALLGQQTKDSGLLNLGYRAVERTFTHQNQHIPQQPPFLMVAVAPAFPIDPITTTLLVS